ncbi:F0F1 ATP synthase subunit A [uncultured Clostridium sp.]|uniref:F0F1 ATP synthase subunit A n=1 Tax=uncultured Clostridium sp. TaxID=59620 RepID=UPI0025D89F36|nr:F0F1 ATP synthase subunit A [uncultured Clostridium sp.]
MGIEPVKHIFSINIGSFTLGIGYEILFQWAVIVVLGIASYLLTRNLSRNPNKKQVVLEMAYTSVENLVKNNMDESYLSYIPYVGTLMIYLLALNFSGLIGFSPVTKNISVTLGLGVSTFIVLNATALMRNGIGGFFKSFVKPYGFMLPINILERITLPISLALRLFGNMLAATILIDMIYEALGGVAWIAGIGTPIIAHGYFDLFDGAIQMLAFTMLTIINIKLTAEHN